MKKKITKLMKVFGAVLVSLTIAIGLTVKNTNATSIKAASTDYESISLTSNSFNKDVIAEAKTITGSGSSAALSTVNFCVDGESSYCYNAYFSQDYTGASGKGFPSSKTITGLNSGATYNLQNYNGNNAAVVSRKGSTYDPAFTMNLVGAGSYESLVFLAARCGTTSGYSNMGVQVNFTDGTSYNSSYKVATGILVKAAARTNAMLDII